MISDVLTEPNQQAVQSAAGAQLELTPSRQFPEWLAEQKISLVFTTYQAGKVFFVGQGESGRLSIFERTLNRCMGLAASGNSLFVSTLFQIWRFENALETGQQADGFDRVFVPQIAYTTGDLDVHDIGLGSDGRPIFVNTLFSCLATVSETHSFRALWQPPFVSRLAAEDRCHLNGLAMKDGQPAFVTAVAETDVVDGWRDHRRDGGCVVDVTSSEVVAQGLSMPHSPRWYRDRLWLHNSGTGEFGTLDPADGRFEPVAFCPGYLRGLAFAGDLAVMGLSKPRENKTFTGLALDDALDKHKVTPQCALYVVDLNSGDIVHWLKIEGVVEELYDISVLREARRPMAVGLLKDEVRRVISFDDARDPPE